MFMHDWPIYNNKALLKLSEEHKSPIVHSLQVAGLRGTQTYASNITISRQIYEASEENI